MTDRPIAPALDDADVAAFVTAAARVQGLLIAPEWHEAVIAQLKATAGAAALVMAFPLPDELDPAPVFAP